MRRNLNQKYLGRKVLDISKTGVLGSLIPSTGSDGASYLYDDVIFNNLQTYEVRGRILSTTIPTGYWFAWNDGRFQTTPGLADGPYTATYELFVNGTKQLTTGTINLLIGSLVAPAISVQPANQVVTAPAPGTFSVTASGTGISYQWQRQPVGTVGFVNITGATTSIYTTPASTLSGGSANNGDSYRCILTNTGNTVTSSIAVLTVSSSADTVAPVLTGTISKTNLTTTSYTISWPAATDNVGVTSYQFRINAGTWNNVGNVLSANVSSRPVGYLDSVDVVALDAAGNLSLPISTTVTYVAPVDIIPPNFIGSLVVSSLAANGYTVTWPAASDANGIASYQYRINLGTWTTINSLSVPITGRTPNTVDTFEVRALDPSNNASVSLTTSITLPNLVVSLVPPSITSIPVGTSSSNFIVGIVGPVVSPVVLTPSDSAGGGIFIPSSVLIDPTTTPTKTFIYVPGSAGIKVISVTNTLGYVAPTPVTITATTSAVTTGPSSTPTQKLPTKAMLLDIRAFVADSNVRRSASSFSLNFPATAEISQQSITIPAATNKLITTPMSPSAVTVLKTSSPLTAQVTLRDTTSFTITITKLFIIDTDVSSINLINTSTTVSATITLLQG